ncbi:MAG: hypothetical protein KDB22_01275 [Planctomycetales bacterium]|nr:hypothetical protein [Planctomycetales bacterium]
MFASFLICVVLSSVANSPDGLSAFSDGPLRITGKQLVTSIIKPEKTESLASCWKCQADGTTALNFGDISATADGMTLTQIDRERYAFMLSGNCVLRMRGLSATATKISWSMDDRPMILSGNAQITVVIDGKPTTVVGETITFDHTDNTLKLPDGITKRLPSSKIYALEVPR